MRRNASSGCAASFAKQQDHANKRADQPRPLSGLVPGPAWPALLVAPAHRSLDARSARATSARRSRLVVRLWFVDLEPAAQFRGKVASRSPRLTLQFVNSTVCRSWHLRKAGTELALNAGGQSRSVDRCQASRVRGPTHPRPLIAGTVHGGSCRRVSRLRVGLQQPRRAFP